MRKGRRIRLPHRSQRPFQFSESRPGGHASEIDLFSNKPRPRRASRLSYQFENSSTFLSLVKRDRVQPFRPIAGSTAVICWIRGN